MPQVAAPRFPAANPKGQRNPRDYPKSQASKNVKRAIAAMAHNGLDIVAAAKLVGLKPERLRKEWSTSTVQAMWREQLKVSRESLTGEALARLRTLSQQDKQLMAAVTATKALLEPPADPAQRGLSLAAAGLVIVIGNTAPQPQTIDAVPVSNNPPENE